MADCEGCIVKLCDNIEFINNVNMIIIENDFNCCQDRKKFEGIMLKNNFREICTLDKGSTIVPGIPPQKWNCGDRAQKAFISVWKKQKKNPKRNVWDF